MKYFLALGSNLGDRRINLWQAVNFLNSLGEVLNISTIYESEPVEMEDVSMKFYNLVLSINCQLSPQELLERIKSYEQDTGRDLKDTEKKPRKIDIDILLAGDKSINSDRLIIPHPKIQQRNFVLIPLLEIAPSLCHPESKKTFKQMVKKVKSHKGLKKTTLKLQI